MRVTILDSQSTIEAFMQQHSPKQLQLLFPKRRKINYDLLAKRIRQARRARGWSLASLEIYSGINTTTLWQIEKQPDCIPMKQFATIYYLLSLLEINLEDSEFTL